MKILVYGVLIMALIFGGLSVSQATLRDPARNEGADRHSCPGVYDFSDTQGVYPGRDFDRWRSMQQERIDEALRNGNLTESDYSQLGRQLNNIESFHDRALSVKGGATAKHQEKMTQMEAQLSGDISASIQKSCKGQG